MSAAVFNLGDGTDTNPTNSWATVTGPNFTTGDYTLKIDTKLALDLVGTASTINKIVYIKTILTSYSS